MTNKLDEIREALDADPQGQWWCDAGHREEIAWLIAEVERLTTALGKCDSCEINEPAWNAETGGRYCPGCLQEILHGGD